MLVYSVEENPEVEILWSNLSNYVDITSCERVIVKMDGSIHCLFHELEVTDYGGHTWFRTSNHLWQELNFTGLFEVVVRKRDEIGVVKVNYEYGVPKK